MPPRVGTFDLCPCDLRRSSSPRSPRSSNRCLADARPPSSPAADQWRVRILPRPTADTLAASRAAYAGRHAGRSVGLLRQWLAGPQTSLGAHLGSRSMSTDLYWSCPTRTGVTPICELFSASLAPTTATPASQCREATPRRPMRRGCDRKGTTTGVGQYRRQLSTGGTRHLAEHYLAVASRLSAFGTNGPAPMRRADGR